MNLPDLFNAIVYATIFGSVVGIIIYFLKLAVLKKLPAKWQCWLWVIMIIKLIFPKGPKSGISIFNKIKLTGNVSEYGLIQVVQKPVLSTNTLPDSFDVIPYIWFVGFVIAMLWITVSFLVLQYRIRPTSSVTEGTAEILERCKSMMSIGKKIEIVVQSHISTTALCGVICPKILITEDFQKEDAQHIEYTFVHELSHYKRGDIAINYLLLFLRCVHWFNPIVWFLFKEIKRDTELAADEMTMLCINLREAKNYGMVIINTLSTASGKSPVLLGMANNKYDIKKRIKAIAKFKKPNFLQQLSGVFAVILIGLVCLTSAVIANPMANIIYESIPNIGVANIGGSTLDFSKETVSKSPEPETEHIEEKADDTDVLTNKPTDHVNSVTDMEKYSRIINYNTDSEEEYAFIIRPGQSGSIYAVAETESTYNHSIYVDISNIKTPNMGWSYIIYTESGTPLNMDGLDPDEEYLVKVRCYCPGH